MAVASGARTAHAQLAKLEAEGKLGETLRHGGNAYAGIGIEIDEHELGPDLTFMSPERVGEIDEDGLRVPPGLVAEVTSPATRSLDLVEKRSIDESLGVAEYWVIDTDRAVVVVHRRGPTGAYAVSEHSDGTVQAQSAPGLVVPVIELLAGTLGPGS